MARRAAATARHRRGQARADVPRPAPRDLARAQDRGAQGLRPDRGRVSLARSRASLIVLQILVAILAIGLWHVLTATNVLPPFFFSTPAHVFARVVKWLAEGTIWRPLGVTLVESVLPFVLVSAAGALVGFWFARKPFLAAVLDPYVKMINALPRVVLAPIFALWLGRGIWSKVALGVTLVFFVVFFNVYQGVKEVSHTVLANARMLGMSERQLMRHVYWPSALSWMFSSLHTSVGFAVVGAVVGEYLGSAAGLGYLIQQAEGVFDVAGGFAGMFVPAGVVVAIDRPVPRVVRAAAGGVATVGRGNPDLTGLRIAAGTVMFCRNGLIARTSGGSRNAEARIGAECARARPRRGAGCARPGAGEAGRHAGGRGQERPLLSAADDHRAARLFQTAGPRRHDQRFRRRRQVAAGVARRFGRRRHRRL